MQESHSAVDDIVRQIRLLIRERGLVVGDALPSETALAQMFDTSRNTVREAVRTLKAYGVAESRQKVGAVLTDRHNMAIRDLVELAAEISVDSFRDIQGYRRLTEMNLFSMLAPRITGDTLTELDATNDRILQAHDPEIAAEHDYRFHNTLVAAADNKTLADTYWMLQPVIQRLMTRGKSDVASLQRVHSEHASIVQALRSRDEIAFVYHMDRHLDAGLEYVSPGNGAATAGETSEGNGRRKRDDTIL